VTAGSLLPMDSTVMWVVGVVVFVLPFVLMVAFNGENRADSRGRRLNRRWHS
jgi:hypothetical protein